MSELKKDNGVWECVHEYPHIYYYIERRFAFGTIVIQDYN
jgi:hypothetical protein